jgi:hypothetical protein
LLSYEENGVLWIGNLDKTYFERQEIWGGSRARQDWFPSSSTKSVKKWTVCAADHWFVDTESVGCWISLLTNSLLNTFSDFLKIKSQNLQLKKTCQHIFGVEMLHDYSGELPGKKGGVGSSSSM